MTDKHVAKILNISGIVQGVGFRPFIYQLAVEYGLTGEVANTASGVFVHIEGEAGAVASFCENITIRKPVLSQITQISCDTSSLKGYGDFSITQSRGDEKRVALISPDVTICDDCLREMFDPEDRRYRYPFINCTNCGPRFTIIEDIPYDRPKTSMKKFDMCEKCMTEYHCPTDRRFHAQPNACPACGPRARLYDCSGRLISDGDPFSRASSLLRQGHILAVKGLGGYHLSADALNHEAVQRLRRRKVREEKPFAMMVPDIDTIRRFAWVDQAEAELISSISRPIVLVKKKFPEIPGPDVSPNNLYYGVMLPYTPLHYLIMETGFTALVMTSGNLSDEPIVIDNDQAFSRLSGIADYFLVHDRDIYLRCDDSVLVRTAGKSRFIRKSRGFTPVPVFLPDTLPEILSCGAELKNTVCLTKDDRAFVSQHIGDLENPETFDYFTMTIDHLKRILDISPEIIAYDLHPGYLSTQYALEKTGMKAVGVQHHHAHIVSCMAENGVRTQVIGLAFDGTGYGTDHAVWGGEVLIAEPGGFSRAGHLEYVPMPGSAMAVKEPLRMGIAYLYHVYGDALFDLDLPVVRDVDPERIRTMIAMTEKKVNSPPTSSMGRLFDGIAAILGLRYKVSHEGQAAMDVERSATTAAWPDVVYPWELSKSNGSYIIRLEPIIRSVVEDFAQNTPVPRICRNFHATLAALFTNVCEEIRRDTGVTDTALSGGVFQNALLLAELKTLLEERGFTVYTHIQVPFNDGGVSLGQAVAAAATVAKKISGGPVLIEHAPIHS